MSRFSVHPGVAHVQKILENLKPQSGLDLDGWVARLAKVDPADLKARVAWLKAQGLGSTQASLVAERSLGRPGAFEAESPQGNLRAAEAWVEAQYSGKKAALRPLFELLLAEGFKLGPEVKACPCKTIVPLYRNHVFAELKPSTQTRIDLGLALGALPAAGRLIDTGGFARKDRITHRIEVRSLAEVDAELRAWLKRAYEADQQP